ncbi:hypothetical protein CCMA1212_001676 [Trichoderma ghanense]|uniref:Uncharacterized protein n=1 Tax=Trichoderma ghanense TaxID=65468 RepID=A0ABY2HCQ8_9HYPO
MRLDLMLVLQQDGTTSSSWGLCLEDSASPLSPQDDSVFGSALPDGTGRWLGFFSDFTRVCWVKQFCDWEGHAALVFA